MNNLDKTIRELTDRLDIVHPYSAFTTTNDVSRRNDGIHYWKGKKIISAKAWNELYEKSSTYTNNYKTILTSRKPLLYFPDDYNGSISISSILEDDKLREEIQKWNSDYYELLEFRKNPTRGKMKCSKCLLSGSHDDPIFIGIEKVFSRIIMKHCNNIVNDYSHSLNITYHCNVMNIFSCPFKSIKHDNEKDETSKYPFKREDLFALHQISFAIEQAISTFFELTKDNEIIYEVDFVNDKVQEIHTKYNGEPESWGWHENVIEQLSKVKSISNIVIRDEQDIYDILTNREKLECLLQEYEKYNDNQLDEVEQQVCYDEKSPCVPNENDDSNNKKVISSIPRNSLEEIGKKQQKQSKVQDEKDFSHKGENCHSKNTKEELDIERLKPELKLKIQEELEKSHREQLILLTQNKNYIIDFVTNNKESIRIEDLKIYEPIYKCYREKGHCFYCNTLTNILCTNCCNNDNNKEVWLCTDHWQDHVFEHQYE